MRINDLLTERELKEFGGIIPAAMNIIGRTGGKVLEPVGKGILKLAQRASGRADDAVATASKGGKIPKGKIADVGGKVTKDGFATFNKATGRLLLVLKGLGLGKMAYDYWDDMEDAVAMVEKGEWPPEKYQQYRQQRMATLVGQIAASTVLFGTLKLATGWTQLTVGMRLVPYAPVANLGKLLSNLDSAATVGLMAYLNTESGKNTVAEIIGACMIDQTLGDAGIAVVDKFKKIFGIKDNSPATPDNSAKADADSAADTQGQTAKDSTSQGTNPTAGQGPANKQLPISARPEIVTSPTGRAEFKIDPRFANVPQAGRTLADMEKERQKAK